MSVGRGRQARAARMRAESIAWIFVGAGIAMLFVAPPVSIFLGFAALLVSFLGD